VYGFQSEQVALVLVVFGASFSAAMARVAPIGAKRNSGTRYERFAARVSFSCTAGFMAVAYLGILGITAGNDWIDANRFYLACFAPVVGFAGPEQQALFVNTLVEIATRLAKKNDK
jgi:hypothetical protein